MAERFRVAVVGVRAVGQEMVRSLHARSFPFSSLRVFATRAREVTIDGKAYQVEKISEEAFKDIDIAFFAGGDKAEGHFGWPAVRQGAVVIDNGSAYRLYPNVPLVVPEVNPEVLRNHEGLIANPNCSTIQFVVALKPLHDAARIKRLVVSTYQAVSGRGTSPKGSEPVAALCNETCALTDRMRGSLDKVSEEEQLSATLRLAEEQPGPEDETLFPCEIVGNCLPHIDSFGDLDYTKEEWKMVNETRKIMGDTTMQITATCVRVPVFNSHCESVNVEFHSPLSAAEAKKLLLAAPGVKVIDEAAPGGYPLPRDASGKDEVFVGRIREDPTVPHGLNLWVVSDNLKKGAALNTIQIAEKMLEMGLLKAKG
ncbi:MAG: aspartate-semialdehyde dehydrogenase [Armatimonadetes bacterium]|nr:aspartate-semialdehyde dehydrogenase [Armatimonadota bacterium]NIM24166.1 aspartate-semialdehyde dehydrogenase [Armatimonadota bacterium]NIM68025.1 aspartate-semialdehyde dehydrogenase [Armatimonadota bacterium]NIM76520.1 aspartate-semialdehyde dehydrogenase [Armatimonadota bacterium]NIN06259.1 aspartate-semialdehyde dehydrogenase [Armatimonadota bacterium]